MKNTKSSRSRVLIIILSVVALLMGVMVAYAASNDYAFVSQSNYASGKGNIQKASTGNPDDNTNYLVASNQSNGLTTITFTPADASSGMSLGTVRVVGDYMYVYGYYYNVTAAPVTSKTLVTDSDTQWAKQTDNLGWGCVAISKTKTSYADPAGAIDGIAVTYMNNAYRGCTNLTTSNAAGECYRLPRIPSTVKRTDYMFGGCTGLVRVSLTTASTLSANTFTGCTNLTRLFIGQNLKTAANGAIGTVAANCQIFLDGTNSYTSGWNSGKTVYTNQDILLWALD